MTISFKEFVANNKHVDNNFKPNLTTELLANSAIELINKYSYKNILDLGCGSGWIALWIKFNFPNLIKYDIIIVSISCLCKYPINKIFPLLIILSCI